MLVPFLDKAVEISHFNSKENIKDPIFSIIIPSWNNLELLKTCINSLKKNSRYEHEIILHLNDGSDGSKEWAETEQLSHTWSNENIGICYAVNIARRLATSEFIVYFNDDMYACPDWDFWLYEEVKKQSSPFFYLSATMIEPVETGNSCVISPMYFGHSPDSFNEQALLLEYEKPKMDDWCGATWPPSLVPALLWDMVGGYSTELSPGMYSDPDFSMKLWHAGVRNFKGIGKSRVYHFMSKSTQKLNKKKVDGSRIFLQKWGITSNIFTRFYLRRGDIWSENHPNSNRNFKFKFKCLLSNIKRRLY